MFMHFFMKIFHKKTKLKPNNRIYINSKVVQDAKLEGKKNPALELIIPGLSIPNISRLPCRIPRTEKTALHIRVKHLQGSIRLDAPRGLVLIN